MSDDRSNAQSAYQQGFQEGKAAGRQEMSARRSKR